MVFTFDGIISRRNAVQIVAKDSANGAGKNGNAIVTLAVRWMNLALSRSQKSICEAGTASISRGKNDASRYAVGMKSNDSGAQRV